MTLLSGDLLWKLAQILLRKIYTKNHFHWHCKWLAFLDLVWKTVSFVFWHHMIVTSRFGLTNLFQFGLNKNKNSLVLWSQVTEFPDLVWKMASMVKKSSLIFQLQTPKHYFFRMFCWRNHLHLWPNPFLPLGL